ncbi:MAG: class I SAM-dependent methyltransferase [Methanopyri archaeon]|nr:class I SAM-dependent methyltransferase [Methanopyri archaeon]
MGRSAGPPSRLGRRRSSRALRFSLFHTFLNLGWRHHLKLRQLVDLAGCDVLDLGGGGIPLQGFYAGGANRYVVGDIDGTSLGLGRSLSWFLRIPIEYRRLDARSLPDERYDVVVSTNLDLHPRKYFEEVDRVLSPGGRFYWSYTEFEGISPWYLDAEARMRKFGFSTHVVSSSWYPFSTMRTGRHGGRHMVVIGRKEEDKRNL